MEMQLSEIKYDIVQGMHTLIDKYGNIQGVIKAAEKMKVPRKGKKGKKVFLKFLRGISYNYQS